ncbi:MAG: hypothetical protein CVU07_13860, partial [Bacteroidetes bacterium HGW-Bacteroidetes-23]
FVKRNKDTFQSPLKPFLQIIYVLFSLWVLIYMLIDRPFESLAGLGLIGLGATLFWFDTFQPLKKTRP